MMHVPSEVQPKSNPAILTPANCVRPVDVADAEDVVEWLVIDVVE